MNLDPVSADPLDRTRFPVDEWRLVETRPGTDDVGTTETLFAVGNGYLGMRGNCEQGRVAHLNGTFVNGFHETWPISHAEEAFGFARTGQTIVNVPDTKTIKLYVDDEPLLLSVAELTRYERSLDFQDGTYRRDLVWRTPSGKRVRVTTTRMVSFVERHLAVLSLEVTMLSGFAPVVLSSQIVNRQDVVDEYQETPDGGTKFDPRKAGKFPHEVLHREEEWHDEDRLLLGYRCANSKMTIAVGADHTLETENRYETLTRVESGLSKHVYRVNAEKDKPIRLTKVVAYHTSRGAPPRELMDRCRRSLDRVHQQGVEHYAQVQRQWLDRYWHSTDVVIEGQPAVQQAVRWALFQLAQAAARADTLGVAAKGVTGSGYEGHYFWDTEIYVVPFLAYTNPEMARNLLRFRTRMLPAARQRAREMSMRGALFPWRTISGEEASAYYAAGTAQYHIDADIAYAAVRYADVTGDTEFLFSQGVDILVETARMWADLGFWRGSATGPSTFHIHSVTGPDEYTTVVNNNLFTNVMARFNLRRAAELARQMEAEQPQLWELAVRRLAIQAAEVEEWQAAADGMVIPFDETLGVHPQDEHFLERELWDLEHTSADMRPLLLNFHPLVIYRFQVLKQADVVLALFLQGDEFTLEQKRADFEYYDPITTGDSTLSAVVQSIVAAEVGYADMALQYFLTGLFVDLADLHNNTSDGVHIASAGGVWNALVSGFGGMRDYDGGLSFDPRLPEAWPELRFPLTVRGHRLTVRIRQDRISFRLDSGDAISVTVRGQAVELQPGVEKNVALHGHGPRLTSLQGHSPVIGAARADGSLITAGLPEVAGTPSDAADGRVESTG